MEAITHFIGALLIFIVLFLVFVGIILEIYNAAKSDNPKFPTDDQTTTTTHHSVHHSVHITFQKKK